MTGGAPRGAGEPTLLVLATTDLHGVAMPGIAARCAEARAAEEAVVVVDNGDAMGRVGALWDTAAPNPFVEWMNAVGYDAANLGNHDLDQGLAGLRAREAASRFPLLCANLRAPDGGPLLCPATAEVDTAAGRVGIAAATTAMTEAFLPPERRRVFRVSAPVAALVRSCRELRSRCRFVIALAHFAWPLPALGEQVAGMPVENPGDVLLGALLGEARADCIVFGHTHRRAARVIDGRAVLLPGAKGAVLGEARLGSDPPVAMLREMAPPPEGAGDEAFATYRAGIAEWAGAPVAGAPSLAAQIWAAAEALERGVDGVVVPGGVSLAGPPLGTRGEVAERLSIAEPLVVRQLDAGAVAGLLARRNAHRDEAESAAASPDGARRRWMAFTIVARRRLPGSPVVRLLVPAGFASGYGGYPELAESTVVPGLRPSLPGLLLAASAPLPKPPAVVLV